MEKNNNICFSNVWGNKCFPYDVVAILILQFKCPVWNVHLWHKFTYCCLSALRVINHMENRFVIYINETSYHLSVAFNRSTMANSLILLSIGWMYCSSLMYQSLTMICMGLIFDIKNDKLLTPYTFSMKKLTIYNRFSYRNFTIWKLGRTWSHSSTHSPS